MSEAPSKSAPDEQREPALDGVRGIAILLVMLCHTAHIYQARTVPHSASWFFLMSLDAGWTGVDLFFVLSGFLITRILVEAKGAPHYFRNFYARRFLRLFPVYYGFLFCLFWVAPALLSDNRELLELREHQGWFWAYAQNVFEDVRPSTTIPAFGIVGHLWSLAIEEQFYLFWPALVFTLTQRSLRKGTLALVGFAIVFRLILFSRGWDTRHVAVLLPSRLDAFALGGLLSSLSLDERAKIFRRSPWLLVGIPIFAVTYAFQSRLAFLAVVRHGLFHSFIAAAYGVLILLATIAPAESALGGTFRNAFLRRAGKYSYAMYVFHPVLFDVIARPTVTDFVARAGVIPATVAMFGVLLLATWSAASLSWAIVEKRFLALKRHFPLKRVARPPERTEPAPAEADGAPSLRRV